MASTGQHTSGKIELSPGSTALRVVRHSMFEKDLARDGASDRKQDETK